MSVLQQIPTLLVGIQNSVNMHSNSTLLLFNKTHAMLRLDRHAPALILSGPSLSHGQLFEPSPYSPPPFQCNDSDSCHCQEEEKLKLGCESAFSRAKQKNSKQRRLTWTVGNSEDGRRWSKNDCVGIQSQQQVLLVTVRVHAPPRSVHHLKGHRWTLLIPF